MNAVTFLGIDIRSPAGDTSAVTHYDGTTGQWREVARTPHPVDEGIAACIGCGCTDEHACLGGCWWLDVDRTAGKGVCCYCEEHLPAFYDQQAAARLDEQEAQARERVRDYIDNAADWTLMAYRVETRDIRDRLDLALVRHRKAVQVAMAQMWLQTEMRDLVRDLVRHMARHARPLGGAGGLASAELCGHKFSGVIFDEIGPSKADRRTKPRAGARP